MDDSELRSIVDEVIRLTAEKPCGKEIPLEVSARHVHLTQEALEQLFGKGTVLDVKKELSQPGQFLSSKKVKLITRKGEIADVSVLGPVRKAIQVELAATDCRKLGLTAPVRLSGDLTGAADVCLLGDCGILEAKGSVIIAKAHAHMTPESAQEYGVSDGDCVRVKIESSRPITLEDVEVRVSKKFAPAVHIDTDEANACDAGKNARAILMGKAPTVYRQAACAKPGAASPIKRLSDKQPAPAPMKPNAGVSFAGKLLNEAAAYEIAERNTSGVVYIAAGTLVTAAAKDVLNNRRIRIEIR